MGKNRAAPEQRKCLDGWGHKQVRKDHAAGDPALRCKYDAGTKTTNPMVVEWPGPATESGGHGTVLSKSIKYPNRGDSTPIC